MKPDLEYLNLIKELALKDIKRNGHVVNVLAKDDWDLITPMLRKYAILNPLEAELIITGIGLTTELYNYYKPDDPILRKKYN